MAAIKFNTLSRFAFAPKILPLPLSVSVLIYKAECLYVSE